MRDLRGRKLNLSLLQCIFCIVVGFFSSISYSQNDNIDDSFYILETKTKIHANIIQKRFDKAIAANRYFKHKSSYCFEIDEEDLELTFGKHNRKVIPKRLIKNITKYNVVIIGENENRILFEQ